MSSTTEVPCDDLREFVSRFQRALPRSALSQFATSLVPLLGLIALMHGGIAAGWTPVLALGPLAGGLTVRALIIQHDCGHGSFLPGRLANVMLGRFCSLLTLTPFGKWRRQHSLHHGSWNDLNRREGRGGDIYSTCLTVAEYRALSPWARRWHRLVRHPVLALLILPPFIFLVLYRVPLSMPPSWRTERRSVHFTNLTLLLVHGGLALLFGVYPRSWCCSR